MFSRQVSGAPTLPPWGHEPKERANSQDTIVRSLVEKRWPVTVGAIERSLRENVIHDRRANLKNFKRVEHLLTLAQLRQMGPHW